MSHGKLQIFYQIKSKVVPVVTKKVPIIIFFETFSFRKRMAIIAEKIGVKEVRGATMLILVESKPMYNRVSPIPRATSPLRRARDN